MCLWSVLMLLEVFGIYVLIFLRFKKKKRKEKGGEHDRTGGLENHQAACTLLAIFRHVAM